MRPAWHETYFPSAMMPKDPFLTLERSAGGWLIPIAIFVLGAIATTASVRGLHRVAIESERETRAILDQQPAANPPAANPPAANLPAAEEPALETAPTEIPAEPDA